MLRSGEMKSETTFIYALVEADTREPRYVGKSDNPQKRFYGHTHVAKRVSEKFPVYRWLRKRAAQRCLPELVELLEVPAKAWQYWERAIIAHFRSVFPRMLNVTAGGENPPISTRRGIAHPCFGRRHTKAELKKMRGRTISAAGRLHISTGHQGNKRKGCTSRFVGVSWFLRDKNWQAYIRQAGKMRRLGNFDNEEKAAQAYNNAAIALYGPGAKLNILKG